MDDDWDSLDDGEVENEEDLYEDEKDVQMGENSGKDENFTVS